MLTNALKFWGVAVLFLLWALATSAAETLPIANAICANSVGATLARWGSANRWGQELQENGVAYRSPTGKIGVWVELAQDSAGRVRVSRLTKHSRVDSFWSGADCQPKLSWRILPAKKGLARFTDMKLEALVKKFPLGLILLWSPHMPYSLRATESIREAAKSTGAHLTFVMDAEADQNSAEKAVQALKLPKEALLREDSLELFDRGMEIHYPTALMYAHGRLAEHVIPGLANAGLYTKYVKENIPR